MKTECEAYKVAPIKRCRRRPAIDRWTGKFIITLCEKHDDTFGAKVGPIADFPHYKPEYPETQG